MDIRWTENGRQVVSKWTTVKMHGRCLPVGWMDGRASLVAQLVENLPVMWETWVRSLGWEDPLQEGTATYSSILAWRIPMDRGAWRAIVVGSQRVAHD